MKISAIVHTYNSERYLARCLESLKDFDEIVLCDMHSTDATLDIARQYGCNIVFHEHTGFVEPARNFAIQQAANEWVLIVDSDEVIPEALRIKAYEFTASCPDDCAALQIPHSSFFMGRFMHSSWPSYIVRLLRKSKTYWPPTIHSRPVLEGRLETLPARRELAFINLDEPSVGEWMAKTNIYTDKECVRRTGQKPSLWDAVAKPWFRFFRMYIIKRGFLDGRAGYAYAKMNATYKLLTIMKLWEQQNSSK